MGVIPKSLSMLLAQTITALDGLIDSRFMYVWYTTVSVDSTGMTNGTITPPPDAAAQFI